jgi:hypothetical protein
MGYLEGLLKSGREKLDKIEADRSAQVQIEKDKASALKAKIAAEIIDFLVKSAGLDKEFCIEHLHVYDNNSASFVFPKDEIYPVRIHVDVQTNPIQVSWKGGFKGRYSVDDYSYGNELDVVLVLAQDKYKKV